AGPGRKYGSRAGCTGHSSRLCHLRRGRPRLSPGRYTRCLIGGRIGFLRSGVRLHSRRYSGATQLDSRRQADTMSRWRPPRPKSSAYITPAGAKKLKDELTYLWKVERPQVTQAVHEAAKDRKSVV